MPRRLPKGCVEDKDSRNKTIIRIYFRAKGRPKVRLRGVPWTPEFMAQYEAAKGQAAPTEHKGISKGTWRWLCVKYFAESNEYKQSSEVTQRRRRSILESTFEEPIAPGSPKVFGDMPISAMTPRAVAVLRDRKITANGGNREGANNRLKAIKAVFSWACAPDVEHATHNPTRDVKKFKTGSEGHHTWTLEEIAQYEERHPIGTKARLALELLLSLGTRRGDLVKLGKQHRSGSNLTFRVGKKRAGSEPKTLTLPILPSLSRVIEASPCGDAVFLVTELGRPFTAAGFGNKFRDWCDQANLHHCTAHGLRKAAAVRAALQGATDLQLMAIFGWSDIKMAQLYTRKAQQILLAQGGMHTLDREQKGTDASPA